MSELKFTNQDSQKREEIEMTKKKSFEIQTNPSLDELVDFEKRSWPEEEQASIETLRKRLADFPQGFTVAKEEEKIVGQTYWKPVNMPSEIKSFEEMSELEVNLKGKTMWGVNLAVDPKFAGKGIASELAYNAIKLARKIGASEMKAGMRLEKMQRMITNGEINSPEEYPVGIDALAKAFITAAEKENVVLTFSKPQKYWEVDEESMGYASILTIEIKENSTPTLDKCIAETVSFGEEKIEYFLIGPHRGCSLGCKFCGVKSARTCEKKLSELGYLDNGKMTKRYGQAIFDEFRNLADPNASDVLLMNGGNIIREEEMYLPAITEWIPRNITESENFNSMAIEVRADDIVSKIETLLEIKKNLNEKSLIVRLPIEYADEKILAESGKGISLETIGAAIEILKKNHIEWDAYAMLGGINLNANSAIELTEKTVRFAFNKGARSVIINAQFVTKEMNGFDNTFVPSLGDVISTLRKLSDVPGKIKVGFDGDELLNPIKIPEGTETERALLRKFNDSQQL